jgi:hypothetical protein
MKTIGPVMSAALLLAAVSAPAGAQSWIAHTVTYTGSYTVGVGTAPTVDVYKVSFTVTDLRDPNVKLAALVLEIGANAGDPNYALFLPAPDPSLRFDNPFQAGWCTRFGKTPITYLTPTRDDADTHLTPPDTSQLYETDSSFLPSGIATWAPAAVNPTEVNDGSVYSAGIDDYVAGVGNLRVAVAVPNEWQEVYGSTIDAAMVGCIRGTTVYCYSQSADEYGRVTVERFLINEVIPEPVCLSVLALGGLALLRRKRCR